MKKTFWSLMVLSMLAVLVLAGCGGGGGGGGDNKAATGANSVVTAVRNAAPVDACPTGGIQVDAGIDDNGNGVLDTAEVDSTQYVCNGTSGTNGSDGLTALVLVTNEPAGANCANGGKKVSAGKDANSNGILDTSEISSSDYLCNGVSGSNGTNGLNSLTAITSEPSGVNCANGGSKITSGLDTNKNNALDSGEVQTTTYVCNGTTGPAGPGVTWVNVTGTSVQAESNKGYMANSSSQVTVTLPTSTALSVGDVVQVSGVGTGGWKIAQNANQAVVTNDLGGVLNSVWVPHESNRNWSSIASSSDGTKLVAVVFGGQIYTSTDSGLTWTARMTDANREWRSIASSSDGTKLVATASYHIYTSTDSGLSWTWRTSGANIWKSVCSSSDGTKLAAVSWGGKIYISTDSGQTWNVSANSPAAYWSSIASSSDGTKLVAVEDRDLTSLDGYIYKSTDSGQTWTIYPGAYGEWTSVASSSDGTKLVAVARNKQIYISPNSGANWIPIDSTRNWQSVASSSEGTKLVAVVNGGQIYTSADSGLTWTARMTDANRYWLSVASSSDGGKVVAIGGKFSEYQIYIPVLSTSRGTVGSISGSQYDAVELQYMGNDIFTVLSHEGYLVVQ